MRTEYCTNKGGDCLLQYKRMVEFSLFVLYGFSLAVINSVIHEGKWMYEEGKLVLRWVRSSISDGVAIQLALELLVQVKRYRI